MCETTHIPVEMDVLRAMGRDDDVTEAWETLKRHGGKPSAMKEGAVVYASFLIDREELDEAWKVAKPGRLTHEPWEEDLKMWYIAAKIAALKGDAESAGKLRNAVLENDPSFPGIDQLERLIAAAE